MRSRFLFAAALAFSLSGCAAHHMKEGDRNAAVGNWATAEAEYRTALAKKPDEPGLKEKHDHAKAEAMKAAKTKAQNCLNARDWPCAQGESDYAANLEPTDGEAVALRNQVHKAYAMDLIGRGQALAQSDAIQGIGLLEQAQQLSNDAEVAAALRNAQASAVGAAVAQANTLRQQAAQPGANGIALYDKAIYLMQWAARSDPGKNQVIAEIQGEKQRWTEAEYERLAKIGDDAAARRDWNAAIAGYQKAEAFRPGGRVRTMIPYVQMCANGDRAFTARDLKGAMAIYQQGANMPEDARSRYAAGQVQAVAQAIDQEYARLLGAGDQFLARHDWRGCLQPYQQAMDLRPGPPAAGRVEYAQVVAEGDTQTAAKNWKGAADAYRKAASWREDASDHYAATQLDRVELKPWKFRFHNVVLRPVQPDGTPWVGPPSVALQNAMRYLMNGDQVNWHAVAQIPPANIPTLQLELAMPDGKRLRTAPHQGIAPEFNADLVIETNAFEDRIPTLKVQLVGPGGAITDIESFPISIKEIIAGRNRAFGRSVLATDITATVSHGLNDVTSITWMPVADAPPPTTANVNPAPPAPH